MVLFKSKIAVLLFTQHVKSTRNKWKNRLECMYRLVKRTDDIKLIKEGQTGLVSTQRIKCSIFLPLFI